MKKKIFGLMTLPFLFFVTLIISSCGTNSKDVTSQIANANKDYMDAFNKGDVKQVAGFYTDSAKLFPANSEVIAGKQAIEGFWTGAMKMGIKKVILTTKSAVQHGNIAIEEGTYKLFAPDESVIDYGKYLVTWKKEGGKWTIERDIWNTFNPAPRTIAAENATVWILSYQVKAGKEKQFEEFNFKYMVPAAAEVNPQMRSTVRLLSPVTANPDGSKTYTYLFEGVKKEYNYDIFANLKAKYGEAKAKEYNKMFQDCVTKTGFKRTVAKQTAI